MVIKNTLRSAEEGDGVVLQVLDVRGSKQDKRAKKKKYHQNMFRGVWDPLQHGRLIRH